MNAKYNVSISLQQQPAAPAGQQDALDKGISTVLGKTGHGQSNSTVEKISDGFRKVFRKITGKGEHDDGAIDKRFDLEADRNSYLLDVPIADKQ
jgi:hypothetical protein